MAFVADREANERDYKRLNKKAEQFIARHAANYPRIFSHMETDEMTPYAALTQRLDMYTMTGGRADDVDAARYLSRLWVGIFKRTVNDSTATHIAYGRIGYSSPE